MLVWRSTGKFPNLASAMKAILKFGAKNVVRSLLTQVDHKKGRLGLKLGSGTGLLYARWPLGRSS